MVRIAGSDIPNLSKIVEDGIDAVYGLYGGECSVDFDEIETDVDVSMNDNLADYALTLDDTTDIDA